MAEEVVEEDATVHQGLPAVTTYRHMQMRRQMLLRP